jgi:Ppx/GppA phosphatase family
VVDGVITALKRFRTVCKDFGVGEGNVRVLATEALREAENSAEVRGRIKEEVGVGWEVMLLGKEVEGRVGAMGVASGFGEEGVWGLVGDLGGMFIFIASERWVSYLVWVGVNVIGEMLDLSGRGGCYWVAKYATEIADLLLSRWINANNMDDLRRWRRPNLPQRLN